MKQLAQFQDGRLEVLEVPLPQPPPGGVLVRTTHSVISVGTELMKVEQAGLNLLQKALARPDQVRKVVDTARNLGWRSAWQKVRNRLQTPTPLGYSAAGVVAEVGSGQTRFRVGDRVACGGAECSFHAEYLAVPDLLVAHIPEGVPSCQAAYTTLAAIALQAVRQAGVGLGEQVLVLGQGLIGLLVTNLLSVQGARVLAADLAASRSDLATRLGAEVSVTIGPQTLADEVRFWTGGCGVDAVVLCASAQTNLPIEQAAAALRDRGRLVIVGMINAELDWRVFYEKEIEVRYSRSYGPGRYDPAYEWGGSDYPIGYVRWTEQRHFEAVLHLMKTGALRVDALTTRRAPFAESVQVYRDLRADPLRDVGVVLEYGAASLPSPSAQQGDRAGERGHNASESQGALSPPPAPRPSPLTPSPSTPSPHATQGERGQRIDSPALKLDVLGAGNFARTMLLPHLRGQLAFATVANATALSASHVQKQFGFEAAATDASAVASRADPATALLIATRHHLHAPLVQLALAAHRHVFVEKPLCLTRSELEQISTVAASSQGSVQVGFNRRFAPASAALKQLLASVPGPKTCSYRVLAGRLDPAHWMANFAESGGRVVGEACHFFDWLCFVFGSRPVRVFAQPLGPVPASAPWPDSIAAQIEFADGSSGQLIYSSEGDPSFPKETISLQGAGSVAEIVNFLTLTTYRNRKRHVTRYSSKGHAEQMKAWRAFLGGTAPHPLPLAQSIQSMLLTFAAQESIHNGCAISLADY